MSDMPPPPPAGGSNFEKTPPPPPPPPGGGFAGAPTGQYGASPAGGYGSGAPVPGGRPGELLDRFVARLIDLILVAVVAAVINGILLVGIIGLDGTGFGLGGSFAYGALSAVISTVLYLGYFAYMESSQGKTLGKMVMKLRVLGSGGGNPTMEEAAKRNIWLALPILGVIPILGGLVAAVGELVAVIMIAVGIQNDPVARRPWTDNFAGTRVVKEG